MARWIGNLANQDVRRCLEIAKNTVTSPHLEVEELLKAYIAGSSIWIPEHKIERAIIKERYDIYPSQDHRFVQNIYWLDDELETSPLLGLRLLLLLRDAQKADARNHFLTVEQTVDYLRAMVVEPRAVLRGLEKMLETGLCLSYDPTVTSINQVRQVELAPAGWQHLYWGMRDPNYIQAMIEVTPLVDPEVYEKLTTLRGQPRSVAWRLELECFCDYLIAEDRKFCQVPQHPAYESQERLCRDLKKSLNRARKATSLALVEEC